MILCSLALALVCAVSLSYIGGVPQYAPWLFVLLVVSALGMSGRLKGALFTGIDVSALATTLIKFGPAVIMKRINEWKPNEDFQIAKNVKMPLALPKLSSAGEPRPYRTQQDTSGNGVTFTDRTLTVNQSKWDHTFDPETYRNTYLAEAGSQFDPNNLQFWQYLSNKLVDDYLAKVNDNAILDGVYNASGTATVDLLDGLVETLTNMSLTPVVTGAITAANAVTKVELVAAAIPAWMRSAGFKIICSWTVFDFYKTHYRTLNPFGFDMRAAKSFPLDGYNATLEPRSYMGTSLGLIAVPTDKKNLWLGTDGESVAIHATPKLNTIDLRLMLPIGLQVADADAVVINDQL